MPETDRSNKRKPWSLAIVLPLAALVCWLVFLFVLHAYDLRVFYSDSAQLLKKSLAWVDQGQFSWEGNLIYRSYRLGPLAHMLAAIPAVVSRNILAQYYFLSGLMVLAVLLYGLASRRLFSDLAVTLACTAAFAYFLLFASQPIKISNRDFLPVFLAAYFLLLVMAYDRGSWRTLLTWLTLGLCLQLHMSCFMLIPTTLIALYRHLRGRELLWTVAGIALAAAVNGVTLAQLIAGAGGAAAVKSVSAGSFWLEYVRLLGPWALGASIGFGAGEVYFFVSLFRIKKLWRFAEAHRPLLLAALFQFSASLLVFPALNILKQSWQVEYILPSVVFLPFVIGLFLRWRHPSKSRWAYVHVLALTFLLVAPEASIIKVLDKQTTNYYQMMRVSDVEAVSRRVADEIDEHSWQNVRLDEFVYDLEKDMLTYQPGSFDTISTFIRYHGMLIQSQLPEEGENLHNIIIMPAVAPLQIFDRLFPVNGIWVVPPFRAGRLQAAIFRLPGGSFEPVPTVSLPQKRTPRN